MEQALSGDSGWGYLLAIGVGLLILLLWKKPRYFAQTLWKPGKPMKTGSFFALLAIFISAQLGIQILYTLLELLANQFGYSMVQSMESAGGAAGSMSTFLYVSLGAPVAEEILFRGLILRNMVPYGKKFAIFASSLLFGLYHGNLVQIPFAFAVGLVLAYVTVEYNIGWAVALHLFNNLILSDTMTRLMAPLGMPWSELWFWVLIVGCTIATLVILIVNRQRIKIWLGQYRDDPLCARAFWSAPGIITLTVVLVLLTLLSTALMMTPIG
jgi:membrane protease YdiL (CAAX protease family)